MKDKIVEESTIRGQLYRATKLTKVYGITSTHEVRNQLIELLRERVNYHKDKFICKTILEELRGMEIKKNGRVEHSDLTHDDNSMSMLLALHVWYNGINLRENFGIEKTAIKTDDYIDDEIEMASGAKEEADMAKHLERFNATTNMNSMSARVNLDLQRMNQSKGVLFSEFVAQQRKSEEDHLRMMLQDERTKDAYARFYGIHPDSVDPELGRSSYSEVEGTLPKSIFTDFNKDPEEMENGSVYKTMPGFLGGQYGNGDDFSNIEDESQQ